MSTREDWMRRLGPLYGGAVALVGSTPWRWPFEISSTESRSSFWVVAVGAVVGVVAYVAAALVDALGMPLTIAACMGLAVLSFSSASIVERGVVQRIDGMHASAPSITSILVLVFGTLIRAAAIVAIPREHWLEVFLATAVVGRWAAVFLQALGDPIVDDDSPRSLVATPAPAWMIAALTVGTVALTVLALGKVGIAALAITAAIAFGLGLDAQRRDRGLTASVVATAAAFGELLVLLLATT